MDRVTQEAYYRQRVLKYAEKHGVTKAAERYGMSRKTVHKWKRRYDGTVESLKNRSRAPLHSPLKQSDWEIQLVQRYARKYIWATCCWAMKRHKRTATPGATAASSERPQSSSRLKRRSEPIRTSRMNDRRILGRKSRWM